MCGVSTAGVVDEDYRGNLGVVLFNFSKEPFEGETSDPNPCVCNLKLFNQSMALNIACTIQQCLIFQYKYLNIHKETFT